MSDSYLGPVTRRSREVFAPNAPGKFLKLMILEPFTEVPFIQETSRLYASLFTDTDQLKVALGARKDSGTFEKQVHGGKNLLLCRLDPGV